MMEHDAEILRVYDEAVIPFPCGERFAVVLGDPPWNFRTRSAKGRNRCPDGQGHYKVMSLADIKALPVGALTAPDSALFLWVVDCKIRRDSSDLRGDSPTRPSLSSG